MHDQLATAKVQSATAIDRVAHYEGKRKGIEQHRSGSRRRGWRGSGRGVTRSGGRGVHRQQAQRGAAQRPRCLQLVHRRDGPRCRCRCGFHLGDRGTVDRRVDRLQGSDAASSHRVRAEPTEKCRKLKAPPQCEGHCSLHFTCQPHELGRRHTTAGAAHARTCRWAVAAGSAAAAAPTEAAGDAAPPAEPACSCPEGWAASI